MLVSTLYRSNHHSGIHVAEFLVERQRGSRIIAIISSKNYDGYAVVALDGVGIFPVVERITAERIPTRTLKTGQVACITTGSPVPDGADAVVKIENTRSVDGREIENEVTVNILRSVKIGENIRPVGSDIRSGELLVDAHERLHIKQKIILF
ncbi:unnamed protein product [Peronospora belbahrii]|uniref:MoeA N-terminal and linker domain-containing protein n=1 Tax=Peronospora belbahrii TaxID=622444 RepID=A0ABN8DB82_9STRA|nr:unnamed protein product [Peronospora belbahrii]